MITTCRSTWLIKRNTFKFAIPCPGPKHLDDEQSCLQSGHRLSGPLSWSPEECTHFRNSSSETKSKSWQNPRLVRLWTYFMHMFISRVYSCYGYMWWYVFMFMLVISNCNLVHLYKSQPFTTTKPLRMPPLVIFQKRWAFLRFISWLRSAVHLCMMPLLKPSILCRSIPPFWRRSNPNPMKPRPVRKVCHTNTSARILKFEGLQWHGSSIKTIYTMILRPKSRYLHVHSV